MPERDTGPYDNCGWCHGEGAIRDEDDKLGADCPRCKGATKLPASGPYDNEEAEPVHVPDAREKLIELYNLLTGHGDPGGLVEDAVLYLREPVAEIDRLVEVLRECQSALTGPAELRQRIEDLIGPRRTEQP